jgi:hypothetical protein
MKATVPMTWKMSAMSLDLIWRHWHIYRNEVQRQVHEVPNDRRRGELSKRLASQFAESRNHVSGTATLDLTFLCDKSRLAALDERAVEGIDKAVFDEKSFAEDHGKGARLAEHEQSRGDGSQWAGREEHHGSLREVGEEEHEGGDTETESQSWSQLLQEGLPEAAVRGEIVDALQIVSKDSYVLVEYSVTNLERIDVGA